MIVRYIPCVSCVLMSNFLLAYASVIGMMMIMYNDLSGVMVRGYVIPPTLLGLI